MSFEVKLDPGKCTGCEECIEVCTADVFAMRNGMSAAVNPKDCVGCLSCIEICEQEAIAVEETGVKLSNTCATLLRDIL